MPDPTPTTSDTDTDAATDAELLRAFVARRDESAFAGIVERHAGLVHGVARRVVQDDALAQDVGQEVFVRLAKGARKIDGVALPAWLHRCAYRLAVNAVRGEVRRKSREISSMKIESTDDGLPESWNEAVDHLDAALEHLVEEDRRAVIARFYDGRSLRDVGAALGKSENAARMQVSRALDKMCHFFRRRGVVVSLTALTAGLTAEFAKAVPLSALGIYTAAGAAAANASGSFAGTFTNIIHNMSTTSKIVGSTLAVFLLVMAGYLYSKDPGSKITGTGSNADNATAEPATPVAVVHDNVQVFINNHNYGETNGCSVDFLPQISTPAKQIERGLSCGHPGVVSKLSWAYLRSDASGDHYAFERTFPSGEPDEQTTTVEIVYTGKEIVVFEDEVHRIVLRPVPIEE